MISGRIPWIDIARGLGIILVIHGHALSSDSYRHLIYAFHMPLFFFLSGLVFNYTKQQNLTKVLTKSAKSILVPYLFFALLSYGLWIIHNHATYLTFSDVLSHLQGIIYGNSSSLFFNIVLWFLPCLFVTKVGFALLAKRFKTSQKIIAALLIFSVVGYIISLIAPEARFPFGVETALTAIVFFAAGSLIRTNSYKRLSIFSQKYALTILVFSLTACFIFASLNFELYGHQIDLRLNNLSNYVFFYIAAFSGIVATIIVSRMIRKNTMLEYIGRYSLVLFALHPIIFFYFTAVLQAMTSQNTAGQLRATYLSPLYTGLSIAIILYLNEKSKKLKPLFQKLRFLDTATSS